MAEAGALSGVRGSRAVQQPGGELHAAGRTGAEELASRGQREGGTKSGGDPLCGGIMPPNRCTGEGVSRRRTAGVGSPHAESACQPDASTLECLPRLMSTWVRQTLTIRQGRSGSEAAEILDVPVDL